MDNTSPDTNILIPMHSTSRALKQTFKLKRIFTCNYHSKKGKMLFYVSF